MTKRVRGGAVAPELLESRLADPLTWPCRDEGINFITRDNCRAPRCIAPRSPDANDSDQDSPKWKKVLADRESEEETLDSPSPNPRFTPSDCPTEDRIFFDRRNLRLMHGQDPVKNPELFTPVPNLMAYNWPAWPPSANKCTCSRCMKREGA